MTTSELRLLIREAISEVLTEGPRDPAIFKAIFMAGGPGAGKSYVVSNLGLPALGFRKDDPDIMYQYFINRAGHDLNTFDVGSDYGQSMRKSASSLTDKRTEVGFLKNRLGVVFDGTGKNFEKIRDAKKKMEELGYETMMVFVNADLPTALERNQNRPRKVPEDMVKSFWNNVQNNIGKFQSLFGQNFIIIDNSSSTEKNDIDSMINQTYKKISRWSKTPPRSPIAKKWIEDHP